MKSRLSANHIGFIVLMLIGAFSIAQYKGLLPPRWRTYTAPDGAFSVELPGNPAFQSKQIPREAGGKETINTVIVLTLGNYYYSCAYFEIDRPGEKTPDQILESARDGSFLKVQATAQTQKRLTVQGDPALEYRSRGAENMLMDTRMVVVDKQLYLLTAVAGPEKTDKLKLSSGCSSLFGLTRNKIAAVVVS